TGADFLIVEPSAGGWGASIDQEGQNGQFCMGNGETYNVPIEVAETKYGLQIEEFKFRDDPSSLGEFIGGKGLVRSYKMLEDNQTISASFGRFKYAPWGIDGGEEGSTGYIKIIRKSGEVEGPYGVLDSFGLNFGDIVQLVTPSGGAYGNFANRDYDKIVKDIKNELYSKDLTFLDYRPDMKEKK